MVLTYHANSKYLMKFMNISNMLFVYRTKGFMCVKLCCDIQSLYFVFLANKTCIFKVYLISLSTASQLKVGTPS